MSWTDWIWVIVCPIIAYFIGAIPFSYIITKWQTGLDLRESGNKNVGGLNTMLVSGFNWGMLAGFLDFAKGLICLILILVLPFSKNLIISQNGYFEISWHKIIYILVCMAVILGHNYSIFIRFKGGRGMASIVSFLLITNPLMLLIFVVTMIIFVATTKYMRPSQLFSIIVGIPIAFILPFFPPWMINNQLSGSFFLGLFVVGITIVILPKYLKSLVDMFKGKEYKFGTSGVHLPDEGEK